MGPLTKHWSRAFAVLASLAVALVALTGTGRADPGEEPDLQVEIVGLKPGSRREVVVRVTNVSEWWSDATRLTVETVAPTPGGRRTLDVPDLNTAAEAPLPNQIELIYSLAADCDGHVVKANLSAGTNYMGEKEVYLDDNSAQAEVCPKLAGGASAPPSDDALRQQGPAAGNSASNASAVGPRLDPNAPAGGSPIRPPVSGTPVSPDDITTDLAMVSITGEPSLRAFGISTSAAGDYVIKFRNDGADVGNQVQVYVRTDGVAQLPNQPGAVQQTWTNAGFACELTANVQLRCTGSLRSGQEVSATVRVALREGEGTITAYITENAGVTPVVRDSNSTNNTEVFRISMRREPA